MSDAIPESERLARLESGLESLASDVRSLAESVKTISEKQSTPNWNALGVIVAATIPALGAAAVAVFGPISSNTERIAALRAETSRMLERERERNNRIERALGRLEGIEEATRGRP